MQTSHGGSPGDLLGVLRDGNARTRSELTELTGQTRVATEQRLQALERLGLVGPSSTRTRTGGRPSVAFEFKPSGGLVVVADLGVRHATLAVADLAGVPLDTVTVPIRIGDGPDIVIPMVISLLDELLDRTGRTNPVLGAGIGIPGPVEHSTGRPSSPPIMPGWDHYEIVDVLESHFGAPALVDNDANLLALGERVSSFPDVDESIYVKVASGVGAGIITEGSLIHGAQGAAGDLGHVFSAFAEGRQCRCGNTGCVETVAGGIGIARILTESGHPAADAGEVAALARAGDLEAIRALRLAGQALGEVLSTCIAILNPQLIVLGGELATAGESLIAGVRQAVFSRTLPLASQDLRVTVTKAGGLGGAIGAARLVLDQVLNPEAVNRRLGDR